MKSIKWILVLSFAFISSVNLLADEGMWLPFLLKQINEADMKKNGCKLTAEDIYSVNKTSLKDAVVHFGGGCTAELISGKGLILTNHHCGYGQIAQHSTVEKDYLTQGFWAMNNSQELICPGLTATLIVRIEDVTDKVKAGLSSSLNARQTDSVRNSNIHKAESEAVAGTHYVSFIRPFFYGNQYILFVTEVFKDVRMVGAPPSSIGKFGGDTDNWAWPRHTGDFSIFRIYANKENKPADYSSDNVPYVPKKFFTISLKGVEEGDFTMVYGFPGRTTEYLHSSAVDMIMNVSDPAKVNLREKRLAVMDKYMKMDDQTRINYAAGYASLANYWKKWKGEMIGLRSSGAVDKKKEFERKFLELLVADPAESEKFHRVFESFQKIYKDYSTLTLQQDYYNEGINGIFAFKLMQGIDKLLDESDKAEKGAISNFKQEMEVYKPSAINFYKTYQYKMDEELCRVILDEYFKGLNRKQRVPWLDSVFDAHSGNIDNLVKEFFTKSNINRSDVFPKWLDDFKANRKAIESDPLYRLYRECNNYYNARVRPYAYRYEAELNELYAVYMQGLIKVYKDKNFYPDANSTLRLTYGKAKGFKPRDGMIYNYYTTVDGILEKENPSVDEFVVPERLKELHQKGDYGQYADKNGKLRVAFLAANHTTGGNSGSPVLNAMGQLVGTNFDRVWEGTMSDIMYNPDICRNISVDIRYTLWVVDKFAGASWLLNEMTIVK